MLTDATAILHHPKKLNALTSMRWFAALWVVAYHAFPEFCPAYTTGFLYERLVSLGFVAVSFFFLLSGYILAFVHLKDRDKTHMYLGKFYLARFARVYPLFVITLLLDMPFFMTVQIRAMGLKAGSIWATKVFFANIFMLQAWFVRFHGPDGPNWSLSVESFFYLLFPFIGIAIWKMRGSVVYLTAIAIYLIGQIAIYWLTPLMDKNAIHFNPALHLSTFALGILLAKVQDIARRRTEARKYIVHPSAVAEIGAAFAILTAFCAVPRSLEANLYGGLLVPIFAWMIWVLSKENSPAAKLISGDWLVLLGESSYGLYLIHVPMLHVFHKLALTQYSYMFPVYLLASVSLSIVSFVCFERKARHYIIGYADAWRKRNLCELPRASL